MSAINYAHARGVTVVGAAGNDESDQIAYPARARNVVSVGATTKDRCLAEYSNGGSGLDLVAPGGGDDATIPDDTDCHPERSLPPIYQLTLVDPPHWARFGYPNFYVGTSMSAPAVSATAALVIASGVIGRHPTPDAILQRLEQTAVQLGATKPNAQYGYGLVDAGAATAPGRPSVAATDFPAAASDVERWGSFGLSTEKRLTLRRLRARGDGRACQELVPDDQHRAGRVVGDLVRHRAEQEAGRIGHPLGARPRRAAVATHRYRLRASRSPGSLQRVRPAS